jgi:hypothetical protein
MTATSLSNVTGSTQEDLAGDCTVTNAIAGASVTFRLTALQRDEDGARLVEYTPVHNAVLLPSSMHELVHADRSMMPVFMNDVLTSMFPDQEGH